ncbi:hypothetical protein AVEN_269288-1 [Araneus ventricosus]|uniref:RNA-directed DNA polymerase n=1 Tax=Araneus ventricosus TaxID=182803 RepID=A0A4Y2L4N5_ARAVE|nr:hypothetical protein AVEN_269288-1 [Araneus ventricosus]
MFSIEDCIIQLETLVSTRGSRLSGLSTTNCEEKIGEGGRVHFTNPYVNKTSVYKGSNILRAARIQRVIHISEKDNVVADALSRIENISTCPLAYEDIARSQQDDEELKQPTSLTLQKLQVPNTDVMLYCNISTQVIRPYIPKTHRYQVFRNLHDLAHPGVRATVRLICSRFVWPKMNQDIVNYTRSCIACQKSKIVRHVHSPLAEFKVPN